MLKTIVLLNIFWENRWWIESSKEEQHLFKIEVFCNIIEVFTDTFDHFNAYFMNKCKINIQINK